MKKTLIIHPFLLPLSLIIFLLANNIDQLKYKIVLTPILAALFIAVSIFFIVKIFIKDNLKSGIVSSAILFAFFYYGAFHQLSKNISAGRIDGHGYLLPLWLAITTCVVFVFVKTKSDLVNINKILNFTLGLFLVISLGNIFIYEMSKSEPVSDRVIGLDAVVEQNNTYLPDIYYIITDEYASLDTLRDYFGYENKEFVNFLKEKGFIVPPKSRSNYHNTLLSLASSLNLKYVNYLSEAINSPSRPYRIPQKMIEDNEAMLFLKTQGYKFITFSSGWAITNFNRNADIFYDKGYLNEFSIMLIRATALKPFVTDGGILEKDMRKRIWDTFEELEKTPEIKGPKFVFVHIVSPHSPYIFGQNGEDVSDIFSDPSPDETKKLYLDQLIFISKKFQNTVDKILEKSENPPIIIIQSDHGVYLSLEEDKEINARIKNFSAYFLPGTIGNIIPKDMSPVNTFRIIFKRYFGLNIETLESRSYFLGDGKNEDVTNKIK